MKIRYYTVEHYFLQQGTQLARMHEYFSKYRVPGVQKHHGGPILVMEAVIAPHVPQVAFITGFSSLDELSTVMTKVGADADLMKRYYEWEKGPEPPFETQTIELLEAAPYSPELVAAKHEKQRVFEWRTYHSPSFTHLKALHERFAGPEIKIFHRVGIHPVLYTSGLIGDNIPNLTYLTPFDSFDAREKAWAAFVADEEWIKVRQESVDKHGQVTTANRILLYKATAYSPVG